MRKLSFDKDAMTTVFISVAIGVAVIALLFLFSTIANASDENTYHDPVSNVTMDSENTGAIVDDIVDITGSEKAYLESDFSDNMKTDSAYIASKYFKYAYPKAKSVSYVDKSASQEDNTLKYKVQLDSGQRFEIFVTDKGDGSFALQISDKNNVVLSYESRKYSPEFKKPKSLASYLPMTFKTSDGKQFSLTTKDGQYYLNINACNDNAKIEEAKAIVKNWLKGKSYNPEEINFNIPALCDGGLE